MAIQEPERGYIFWPVGTGDSTTVRIDENIYLQIDLRHMDKSEDNDDPAWPIIDELIDILPTLDDQPYLSTFALTHPDQNHCQGFEDLSERVFISELWMSPRTYREYENEDGLCDDAEAFHEEAMRRVKATIEAGGDPGAGDRIRIIGYDSLLEEKDFDGFPAEFLSIPGHTISMIDGEDLGDQFEAFVHAPFKDDSYGDRNDCSLAFQITLKNGEGVGQALLMGDLKYPIVKRIFDVSDEETLSWNVLLAPHHCSKSVMYWKDEGEDEEMLQEHIMTDLANAALDPGYIVASSAPIPDSNEAGDNPPHALAEEQYQSIVPNDFFCTHEHLNEDDPSPVVFEVTTEGFAYLGDTVEREPLENALKSAGASGTRPTEGVGFGRGAD